MPKIAILMGSTSDNQIMSPAEELLKSFGTKFEKKVLSAHRNPEDVVNFAKRAKGSGIEVIIAGAGKAAHLPGVVASYTSLPVIGVPISAGPLSGLDALFSMVQMPTGVPVATVAINDSKNAALLAIQILALKDKKLSLAFEDYRRSTSKPKKVVVKPEMERPIIDG